MYVLFNNIREIEHLRAMLQQLGDHMNSIGFNPNSIGNKQPGAQFITRWDNPEDNDRDRDRDRDHEAIQRATSRGGESFYITGIPTSPDQSAQSHNSGRSDDYNMMRSARSDGVNDLESIDYAGREGFHREDKSKLLANDYTYIPTSPPFCIIYEICITIDQANGRKIGDLLLTLEDTIAKVRALCIQIDSTAHD
jgi:hypothetical protein